MNQSAVMKVSAHKSCPKYVAEELIKQRVAECGFKVRPNVESLVYPSPQMCFCNTFPSHLGEMRCCVPFFLVMT
jgi:hypothetical protein